MELTHGCVWSNNSLSHDASDILKITHESTMRINACVYTSEIPVKENFSVEHVIVRNEEKRGNRK